ncbi:hypothetical protein M569_03012, partial [Genlisea aurea]
LQKEELEDNKSHRASLENLSFELHDYAIAADVTAIFVAKQYEAQNLELTENLHCSEACLGELQKKH